jgi:hypothetical protein
MKPVLLICILFCALPLSMTTAAFAAPQGLPQIAEQPARADPHREFLQALADAARKHPARHRASQRSPRMKVHEIEPDVDVARPLASPRPVAAKSQSHGEPAAMRKVETREAAERQARTEYLYRVSQTSAPIIPNATACKRIGANGESIYENCGTTVAAGAGGAR